MILVLTGTHDQPFDRLVKWVDRLAASGKLGPDVLVQRGASRVVPRSCRSVRHIGYSELRKLVRRSEFVISHAGAGTVIDVLSERKPLILVPRFREFGEHGDDHQIQLADALYRAGRVLKATTFGELEEAVENVRSLAPAPKRSRIPRIMRKFLHRNFKSAKGK